MTNDEKDLGAVSATEVDGASVLSASTVAPHAAPMGPGRYGTCEGHPRTEPDYASVKAFTHLLTEYGNEPTPERYIAVMVAHEQLVRASERCICAAVRLDDGRMFYGHRHHNAMASAREHGFGGLVRQDMQGFVTTQGRYVDRSEGLALQEAARIPSARGAYNGRALFSEDLY